LNKERDNYFLNDETLLFEFFHRFGPYLTQIALGFSLGVFPNKIYKRRDKQVISSILPKMAGLSRIQIQWKFDASHVFILDKPKTASQSVVQVCRAVLKAAVNLTTLAYKIEYDDKDMVWQFDRMVPSVIGYKEDHCRFEEVTKGNLAESLNHLELDLPGKII
jgi:hypothetical protein